MVLLKGMRGEDQRNKVQSGVQVPGGARGPEDRGKRDRGPGGPSLRGASGLTKWKRHFLEHGAEVFGGKRGGEGVREEDRRTRADAGAEGSRDRAP